jgi:hypothetical protein
MNRDRCSQQLVNFLRDELAVTEAAIAVALRHQEHETDPLPVILWQYGLISLEQLGRIFDWLSDPNSLSLPAQGFVFA